MWFLYQLSHKGSPISKKGNAKECSNYHTIAPISHASKGMLRDFPGGTVVKNPPASAGDMGSIPGLGRSPGEGKGYPLQYSGLENFMDCIVHGVTKSQT